LERRTKRAIAKIEKALPTIAINGGWYARTLAPMRTRDISKAKVIFQKVLLWEFFDNLIKRGTVTGS
jgi:hypothetical protein